MRRAWLARLGGDEFAEPLDSAGVEELLAAGGVHADAGGWRVR
jgi:hypothetical protein